MTPERFWRRVDRAGECWLWRGSIGSHGYGHFRVLGRNYLAHRYAWTITNGTIARGLCVLHRCNVRGCVRPAHLYLGTQRENARDAIAAGFRPVPPSRRREIDCRRGHAYARHGVITNAGHKRCRECARLTRQARYARGRADARN